jgi:hypothetical protein
MHSHSADYEVDSLPDDVQRHVTAEVRKFLSAKDAEGKQGRKGRTQGVSWGFKAPVSMLLVPFFAQMTSGVKFLHVVSSQAVYASRLKPRLADVSEPWGSGAGRSGHQLLGQPVARQEVL